MSELREFISYLYKTEKRKYMRLLLLLIGAIVVASLMYSAISK